MEEREQSEKPCPDVDSPKAIMKVLRVGISGLVLIPANDECVARSVHTSWVSDWEVPKRIVSRVASEDGHDRPHRLVPGCRNGRRSVADGPRVLRMQKG